MSLSSPPLVDSENALYRAVVTEAAAGGAALMGALIRAAAMGLHTREKAARDLRERDALAGVIKLLQSCDMGLRAAYPKALLAAFLNPEIAKSHTPASGADVNFDDLELMDEVQVHSSVVVARAQQSAMLASLINLWSIRNLEATTGSSTFCGNHHENRRTRERNQLHDGNHPFL